MKEIRISVISIFLFIFVFSIGFSPNTRSFSIGVPANEVQGDVKKSYFGRIGEEEILLKLVFSADGETVKGHYSYNGKAEIFEVEGSLNIHGRIWLHSPENFKGQDYSLAGLFINSKEVDGLYQEKGQKAVPLVLNEDRVPEPAKISELAWSGKWYRNTYRFMRSEMEIAQLTDRIFYYSFGAWSGFNTNGYSGFVQLDETQNCGFTYNPSGELLIFEIDKEIILVKKSDGELTSSLNGARIDGIYSKEKKIFTPEEIEYEFVTRGVFTEEQNQLFKEMVGEYLPLFTGAFHALGESKNLDSGEAKVFHMWVRGVYPYHNALIIVNEKNEIWAAAVEGKTMIIHCFTNTKHADQFSLTFQEWKERIHEKGIIYH